jgi:hypothetical protein
MNRSKRLIVAGLASALLYLGAAGTGVVSLADVAYAARNSDAAPSETAPAPPRGTRTVEIYKVSGLPKYGGPGWATGAECRSYADAMNALNDKAEENQKNGVDNLETFQQWDGIKKAGGARGCMFTQA